MTLAFDVQWLTKSKQNVCLKNEIKYNAGNIIIPLYKRNGVPSPGKLLSSGYPLSKKKQKMEGGSQGSDKRYSETFIGQEIKLTSASLFQRGDKELDLSNEQCREGEANIPAEPLS